MTQQQPDTKEKENKLVYVTGNLLESTAQFIAHNCNCLTEKAAGLALVMFKRFPYSDIYKRRKQKESQKDSPGTIVVRGDGKDQRFVINMLAQYYPGPSKNFKYGTCGSEASLDSYEQRKQWFATCLQQIKVLAPTMESIAFPYQIGCGLAQGKWADYEQMLAQFAKEMPNTRVFVYRLPGE